MTEQVDTHRKIGLWTALTAIAIVGSTLAGAGWVAGRIYLQDEISQYKQSAKWKAPEVIEKIGKLSTKLSQQLDAISDYDALKEYKKNASIELSKRDKQLIELTKDHRDEIQKINKTNEARLEILKGEMTKLQKDLSSALSINESLKAKIEELRGEIIYIQVGEAESVGHKAIRVGVSRSSAITNYASVTSGEYNNSTMEVGDNFARIIDGKKYVITLVKVSDDYCGFSYDVFEHKKP